MAQVDEQPKVVNTVQGGVVLKGVTDAEIDVDQLWAKGAHVEAVDFLSEKKRISEIRKLPLESLDGSRLVLYLSSVASLTPNVDEKRDLLEVCYDLSLSHGDVVTALQLALLLEDNQRVYEIFDLCKSGDAKVPLPRQTNVLDSDAWPESVRLTYNIDPNDTAKIAAETKLRRLMLIQLCYALSRHEIRLDEDRLLENIADQMDVAGVEELKRILRREHLSDLFQYLASELEVVEPRSPEDIFKSELEDNRRRVRPTMALDAPKVALASAYVSGFVHAGFNMDALLLKDESISINKARGVGVTGSTAALGLICLWNIEEGLSQIDKFQYSTEPHTRAGALLAFGLNSCNVANECDPVLNLVQDALKATNSLERHAAVLALAYAYVGRSRAELTEMLVPIILDLETPGGVVISASAALALGMVFVGTGDEMIAEAIIQTILERADAGLIDNLQAFNFSVALALLYLERTTAVEACLVTLGAIEHPIGEFTRILVEGAAYAGTGDVVKVQELIHTCIKRTDEACAETPAAENENANKDDSTKPAEKKDTPPPSTTPAPQPEAPVPAPEAPAGTTANASEANAAQEQVNKVKDMFLTGCPAACVLAVALVTLRDEIDLDMTQRLMNHLLQFDGLFVKRAVPIAVGLQAASNPRPHIVDLLSKLSHDQDADTALQAIVGLGMAAAGTNNARVAQLLRQLAVYYGAEPHAIFLVRMSQGLLYCGKGLVSLSPLHSDRKLINRSALAGLLAFSVQALFTEETLCQDGQHLNMYHLVPAIHPRWLVTVDEELTPIAVQVRVGQALDVAGLAGQPKKITGFRTHNTPVLLAYDERAQMGSDDWYPLSPILEGVVICRRLAGRDKVQQAKALE